MTNRQLFERLRAACRPFAECLRRPLGFARLHNGYVVASVTPQEAETFLKACDEVSE